MALGEWTISDDLALLDEFDLSGRPFTRALLSAAIDVRKTLTLEAGRANLNVALDPLPSEIDDLIFVAMMILAPHMLRVALEGANRLGDSLPLAWGEPPPKDAPAFLVFARVTVLCFWASVKNEGWPVPFSDVTDLLARWVYPAWPEERLSYIRNQASQLYDVFINSDNQSVQEWLDDMSKVVTLYVEHWINPAINKEDAKRALSMMFQRLSRTIK